MIHRINDEPVRVAVIGAGHIGSRHLECLRGLPGAEAIVIPARPRRVPELERAGFKAAQTLKELDSSCRLGVIATDTARHLKDSLEALEEGLDLLVEKPLGVDSGEALRIREAAVKAKRHVFVGCVIRFSESLCTFRELLPSIGWLHSVQIVCQSYLPDWHVGRAYRDSYSARSNEGGVLRDLIHEVDYAGWLFGWPRALQARLGNTGRLGIASEEMAQLFWETELGCYVTVSLDYITRPRQRWMKATGERGTLEWDGLELTVTLRRPGEPDQMRVSRQTKKALYSAQLSAFVEACFDGGTSSNLTTCHEGYRALAICDAARRASKSRAEEKIKYNEE